MPRSLLPREHGAYAQLAMPLFAALVAGAPGPGALFAVAAVAAFIANEPLLVLLGHRGARMKEQARSRAWRWLVALLAVACATGLAGLALAGNGARLAAAIPVIPMGVLILLAVSRAQRSFLGELLAAVALPGAAVPVAVAGGVPLAAAIAIWLAWCAGYVSTVIAVHRVIARRRGDPTLAGALVLAASAASGTCHPFLPAVPLVVTSALLVLRPPQPRKLRAIGFMLVGASALAALTAILAA